MRRMKKDWLLAILYVCFIYATLNFAPAPLQFLRSHNLLRLSLAVVYVFFIVGLLTLMIRRGEKRWWRYVLFLFVISLYPLIAKHTSSPEEQIHFFEYGLVGVLFARALAAGKPYAPKIWLGAFVLGTAAGWLDEILQGMLPTRHYDVRDIWLNAISVALGLLLKSLIPLSTQKTSRI